MPWKIFGYFVSKSCQFFSEVNFLSSRVLLLNDLNSRIPISFGEESTQAILSGKGEKKPYTLHFWRDLVTKKYKIDLNDTFDPDCLWERVTKGLLD